MVVKGQRIGKREAKTTQNLSLDFGDQPVAEPEHKQGQGIWETNKVVQEEEL